MSFFDSPTSTRTKKLRAIKASGFKSTIKFKLAHCFIAIDDVKKQWFILDEDNPSICKLHNFSEIIEVQIVQDQNIIISRSTFLSPARMENSVLGVRLVLSDISDPMVYANCMNARGYIDGIYSAFTAVLTQVQKTAPVSSLV